MNKNKHLTLSERILIEQHLNNQLSFKGIGRDLSKDPTTIAKEVKNHTYFKSSGAYGRPFNDCINRNSCTATNICGKLGCRKNFVNSVLVHLVQHAAIFIRKNYANI